MRLYQRSKRLQSLFHLGIRAIGINGVIYPLAIVGQERDGAVDSRESVALVLKEELDDIRYGRKPDLFGWNHYIDMIGSI